MPKVICYVNSRLSQFVIPSLMLLTQVWVFLTSNCVSPGQGTLSHEVQSLLQRTSTNKPRKLISSPVQFQVTKFYFYVILSILTKSFWFITKGQVLFLYLYSDNDTIISFQFYNLSLIFTSLLQINFEFKLLRNFISFVRKFCFFLFIFKCYF